MAALSNLLTSGNPLFKDGKLWSPHRPPRPEKSEGGIPFKLVTDYEPRGDPAGELVRKTVTALRLGEPQISEVEEDEITESVLAAAFSAVKAAGANGAAENRGFSLIVTC